MDICSVCAATHYNHGVDSQCSTWAIGEKDALICWDCAHRMEVDFFLDTGKIFAYVADVRAEIGSAFGRATIIDFGGRVYAENVYITSPHDTYIGCSVSRRQHVSGKLLASVLAGTIYADMLDVAFYGWHWPDAGQYCRLQMYACTNRRLQLVRSEHARNLCR